MAHKIHKIAIISDDIEGAVEFYTKKLGLTVMERFANEDDEDYVFLDAGGSCRKRPWVRRPVSTTSPSMSTALKIALRI